MLLLYAEQTGDQKFIIRPFKSEEDHPVIQAYFVKATGSFPKLLYPKLLYPKLLYLSPMLFL